MSATQTATQQVNVRQQNVGFGSNVSGRPSARGRPRDANRLARYNENQLEEDPSSLEPSLLAQNSSLMVRDVPRNQHYPTTCWMEPLGFCTDGLNRNGWCSWHVRHLFNGQLTSVNITIVNNGQIEVVRYHRMLTYIPMPFRASSVYVFPIIELHQDVQSIKDSINLSLLQYTLEKSKKYSPAEIAKIVGLHKAYFIQMIEASTSNSDYTQQRVHIDPIVRLNTAACVNYVSDQLLNKEYKMHVVLADENDNNSIKHLDLHKCTTLTQSMLLLFDLTYGFPSDMNVCLSISPSFSINRGQLVADESRMSMGTYMLDDGSRTYGTPCNISMFRYDTNGDVSFFDPKYKRSAQKCVSANVNQNNLFQYLYKEEPIDNNDAMMQ